MRFDRQIITLVFLVLLLVGCTKTEIISEPASEYDAQTTEETTAAEPKVNVMEEKLAKSCQDTDSGQDPTSKGTISGTWEDGTTYENEDDCFGGVFLVEYYCEGNQPKSKNYRCEIACKRGVCT